MISVVLTLKNRADLLAITLPRMIEVHPAKDWELVVVDDSSTDGLVDLLRKYQDQVDLNYVQIDNHLAKIPIKVNNPALGINIGVKHAKYQTILKTDPECWFVLDNISSTLTWYNSYIFAIGTAYQAPKGYNPKTDPMSQLTRIRDGLYYYIARFSKSVFLEIRGIDEGYGHGFGAEDEDFRERWARIGSVRHDSAMQVIHLYHLPKGQQNTPDHDENVKRLRRHQADPNRIKANEGHDWGSERVIVRRGLP